MIRAKFFSEKPLRFSRCNGPGLLSQEKPPHQRKFCMYLFLVVLTAVFIYIYSYPLEINTNIFALKNIYVANSGDAFQNSELSVENYIEINEPENDKKLEPFHNELKDETAEDFILTQNLIKTKSNEFDQVQSNTYTVSDSASSQETNDLYFKPSSIISYDESHSKNDIQKSTIPPYVLRRSFSTNENITSKQKDKNSVNFLQEFFVEEKLKNKISTPSEISTPSDIEKGFIIFSKHCKIPDIDPLHPSILEFVEPLPPVNCEEEPPITKTIGNYLIVDKDAVKANNLTKVSCCYKPIYRDEDGVSDDKYRYGKCQRFTDKTKIEDEFIKVRCKNESDKVFYHEFHSFIHDKPLVEERCDKQKPPPYSVMIIGIDGVSRLNVHRHMNKTVSYLLNDMKAVEMFGFNKIGDNTFPNLVAMLLGYDEMELPDVCWKTPTSFFTPNLNESLDKCNFIWKDFAEKGYRTLYAEDAPEMSTFNYAKKGFLHPPTDYYFRHFIMPYEEELGWQGLMNCYMCVGSVSVTEAILQWTESFANNFKNRAHFSFSWINSPTHDDLNYASQVDNIYEKFFSSLHKSGALNRTIVFFMSDHGVRYGKIRQTYIGRLEERLPLLFISLPSDFQKHYPQETKSLNINSRRLVTPFDLHATLQNILHLQENDWSLTNTDTVMEGLARNFTKRAHSLLRTVPLDRSCDDAFISQHFCTCKASISRNEDDERGKHVGKFLVKHINKMLKPVSEMCAPLKLHSVNDVRITFPEKENMTSSEEIFDYLRSPSSTEELFYTVIVQTKPNDAIFEGTVRIAPPEYVLELIGTISRLNLYGKQSHCVYDAILKKYCYCKDNKITS